MHRITKIAIGILIIMGLNTCTKDWLDVNDNPNAATSVSPKLLVNSAMLDFNSNLLDVGITLMYWSQHWAAGSNNYTYADFAIRELYESKGVVEGNTWRNYYVYCLKNLTLADEIAGEEKNPNGQAISKILSVMIYYYLTIMWEDVPFSQALDHENYRYPEADDQRTILEGLLDMLDDAIALIDKSEDASTMKTYFYYDNVERKEDMAKWEKLANSFKLRILMVMATKEPATYSSMAGALISSGVPFLESNDDNLLFPYYDQTGNKNPFYRIWESYTGGSSYFFFPSKTLIELMNYYGDPRLKAWFIVGSEAEQNTYVGVKPAEPYTSEHARVGSNVINPSTPHQLATCSETELFIAEAYMRGWVDGEPNQDMAVEHYKKGIRASMEYYSLSETDISGYINFLVERWKDAETTIITEYINQQQYIDCFFKPHEGWVQVRRTNVPKINVPKGAKTAGLAKRFFPPTVETDANSNISFDKDLDEKMWIDP